MNRVVVLISGNGSNLQALIDSGHAGDIDAEIVAVVSSDAEAFGLTRAGQAGIPTEVVDLATVVLRAGTAASSTPRWQTWWRVSSRT